MADNGFDPLVATNIILQNGGVPLVTGGVAGSTIYICPGDVLPGVPEINIPGVGAMRAFKDQLDGAPYPYEMAAKLLQQVQPMLQPIISVLRIIGVIINIISCFGVLKKPWKLRKYVRHVKQAMQYVLQFVPGITHVRTVRDVLSLIASIIHGLAEIITRWLIEIEQLVQALQVHNAIDDPELATAIQCSQQRLVENQQGMIATLGDIGALLAIVGQMLDIIKSFLPGSVPKKIVELIKDIALLPLHIQLTSQTISGCKDPIQLQSVGTELQSIAKLLDGIGDTLDNVVVTLTEVVG